MKSVFGISGVILLPISMFLFQSFENDQPALPDIITTTITSITQTMNMQFGTFNHLYI